LYERIRGRVRGVLSFYYYQYYLYPHRRYLSKRGGYRKGEVTEKKKWSERNH